jgi:hypothetical protein
MMADTEDRWTQRGLLIMALVAQLAIGIVAFVRLEQRVVVLEAYAKDDNKRVDDHINNVTAPLLDRLTRVEERQQNVLRVLGRIEIMLQGHLLEPSKKMYPPVPAIEDRPQP